MRRQLAEAPCHGSSKGALTAFIPLATDWRFNVRCLLWPRVETWGRLPEAVNGLFTFKPLIHSAWYQMRAGIFGSVRRARSWQWYHLLISTLRTISFIKCTRGVPLNRSVEFLLSQKFMPKDGNTLKISGSIYVWSLALFDSQHLSKQEFQKLTSTWLRIIRRSSSRYGFSWSGQCSALYSLTYWRRLPLPDPRNRKFQIAKLSRLRTAASR